MSEHRAPVGTRDVLPPESERWAALVSRFATHVGSAGYRLLQSPAFEEIGVFRPVGEGTDVLRKEMYDFLDKGGRHLALRPEGTASVVRAFVQHKPATAPWKVWYAAPNFRYERPQAGRYRQHHQLGVEALGSDDPDLDVEVIALLADFYGELGLRGVSLVLNSMGEPADRRAYVDRLRSFLVGRIDELATEDREKVEAHPMRVLDSKRPASVAVVADAPSVLDTIGPGAVDRFERVQRGLTALGVAFEVEPRLVRGLDYYTHTTFEFRSTALDAAQNAVGGGGRYDGLAEALGGPPAPGVGFGSGIERVLLACDAEGCFDVEDPHPHVYVVDLLDGSSARDITAELRRGGLSADRAFGGRSMKAQMRAADRSRADWVVIVGEDEASTGTVTLRDMRGDGGQRRVEREDLLEHLIGLGG